MRKKIAIMGDKGSVLGFKAVGFEVFETENPVESTKILDQLAKGDYGIVFVTEQVYSTISDYIDTFKDMQTPAIIPIPGKDGSMGIGMSNLSKNVERAVGADILFNDKK